MRLPRRQATLVTTWRATDRLSLTAAAQSGLLATPPTGFKVGGGFQTRVLLYGTFFMIPGILYGIAAWDYRRATSGSR